MNYGLFTVYDKKLEAYAQPYFSPNIATALRAFVDACADKGSMLYQHPEDFQLCKIADYDDQTGSVEGHPVQALQEATINEPELREVSK